MRRMGRAPNRSRDRPTTGLKIAYRKYATEMDPESSARLHPNSRNIGLKKKPMEAVVPKFMQTENVNAATTNHP